MGLKGDLSKITKFAAALRELPRTAAIKVAAASADEVTSLAKTTFAAGENAYGDTWSPGAMGQAITLRASGALERYVRYVAIGTKLRVALGVPYAKYQIGKRPIFPRGALPTAYVRAIGAIAARVLRAELGGAT